MCFEAQIGVEVIQSMASLCALRPKCSQKSYAVWQERVPGGVNWVCLIYELLQGNDVSVQGIGDSCEMWYMKRAPAFLPKLLLLFVRIRKTQDFSFVTRRQASEERSVPLVREHQRSRSQQSHG